MYSLHTTTALKYFISLLRIYCGVFKISTGQIYPILTIVFINLIYYLIILENKTIFDFNFSFIKYLKIFLWFLIKKLLDTSLENEIVICLALNKSYVTCRPLPIYFVHLESGVLFSTMGILISLKFFHEKCHA